MKSPCNCYYGEDCTKTTVCANEAIVEELEERVHFLECQLEACKKLSLTRKEEIERLEKQVGDRSRWFIQAQDQILQLEEELEHFKQSGQVHREQRESWKAAHDAERKDRLRLQERVIRLEAELKNTITTKYHDEIVEDAIKQLADKDAEIERLAWNCRVIEELKNLYAQATTERSHFYVAKVVKDTIAEIERMEDELADTKHNLRIAKANYAGAEAEIERLEAALREMRDYPEGEDGRLDSMEAIAREALGEFDD